MGKISPTSVKYIIRGHVEVEGVVEEHDVIGAIFGQTEGLLGKELELRKLQKTGRIGRIKVNIKSEQDKSYGDVIVPSNLSKENTAIVAAAVETVDRVGPCEANIKVKKIEDVRVEKREYVVDRAKELLKKTGKPGESNLISKKVKEAIATSNIKNYKGLPAGPRVPDSEEIVVVEGRADVLNLLKNGIDNVIAINGTRIPKPIIELSKNKKITVFLDGDRGGELILKELRQVMDIDNVAKAPEGKEVEELTFKEIHTILRKKVSSPKPIKAESKFKEMLKGLSGTREAFILDENLNVLGKVPVKELYSTIKKLSKAYAVVLDGYITKNLANLAKSKGIQFLIGKRSRVKGQLSINILTYKNL